MNRFVHVGAYGAACDDELRTRMLAPDDIEPWEQDSESLFYSAPAEDLPATDPESTPEPAANDPSITTEPPVTISEQPRFSFFERPVNNIIPCRDITMADLYRIVTSDYAKAETEHLRTIADDAQAKLFKKFNFDYVTVAGTFTKRENKSIVKPSGLMVIDIDDLKDSTEVEDTFQLLLDNPRLETQMLFRSPGGLGLKWIIPIINNEGHDHQFYFQAVSNYLSTYGIVVDSTGKDVSRACYIPCDPRAFIHPKYL